MKRNEDEFAALSGIPMPRKVYREENTIFFYDELDVESLYIMKKHMREILRDRRYDHVNIVLDSFGGLPCAVYDFLKAYPLRKIGFVEGYCCSGATTILLGCDEKYMAPSSLVLIHSYQGPGEEHVKEGSARDDHLNTVKQNDTLRRIYKKETRIPPKELETFMSDRERFLNAEECLRWKIIDGVRVFVGE